MQIKELRDRLKTGNTDGVYLFAGEEDYLKRHYLTSLRQSIVPDETAAAFSHFVFEGASVDFATLRDILLTPCMLTEKKLCEWHIADFEAMKEKELAALEELCKTAGECPGNTVVFIATPDGFDPGTERKPTKLHKRLSLCMQVVVFERSTDAQLESWIGRHFSAAGISFPPSLPEAMLLRVGHSMDILASEIEKTVLYAKAHELPQVDEKVLSFVTVSTVESDAFSLSNAILDGRTEEAFRFLGDMKRRKVEPVLILGQLARLYGDMLTVALLAKDNLSAADISRKLGMHAYKTGLYLKSGKRFGIPALRRALSLCSEIDRAMKNGAASYLGLEKLIVMGRTRA